MQEKFIQKKEREKTGARLPVGKPITERDNNKRFDLASTAKDKIISIRQIPNVLGSRKIEDGDTFSEEMLVVMFDLEVGELSKILEEKYGYKLENPKDDVFVFKKIDKKESNNLGN
jgi:hypothetical protein